MGPVTWGDTSTPSDEDLLYWIAFASLGGAKPEYIRSLVGQYGDLKAAWDAQLDELMTHLPPNPEAHAWANRRERRNLGKYREILATCVEKSIRVLTWEDPAYPKAFFDLEDPPMVLYTRGQLPGQDSKCIAVVGTREPTGEGSQRAFELGAACARLDVGTVSGLALGIDAQAHRGSLSEGGYTVAVLGAGPDEIFPPEHSDLAEEISRLGLLISEYPPGFKVRAWSLRARNRIIAALSLAVIVVEARERSGAYIAARHANRLRRKLFAYRPSDPTLPTSVGPERLIARGAIPITRSEEVLDWLARQGIETRPTQTSLRGQSMSRSRSEPADEEDAAIQAILFQIGNYLQGRNIHIRYITETKLAKWVHEVAQLANLPITRSWYLRGCYVYSPTASLETLRRWADLRPHASADVAENVRESVARVAERWNIVYSRGDDFLERFYKEAAPEAYRPLYLANLRASRAISDLSQLLDPIDVRRLRGNLEDWAKITADVGSRLLPALEDTRRALMPHEEFDFLAPEFEAFTFLLEDVGLWVDRASSLDASLSDEAKGVAKRIAEAYSDTAWRMVASKIAGRLAEGPRAGELTRTMERSAAELDRRLKQSLPQLATHWSGAINSLERQYRARVRTTASSWA